jgi:hypothetical protein
MKLGYQTPSGTRHHPVPDTIWYQRECMGLVGMTLLEQIRIRSPGKVIYIYIYSRVFFICTIFYIVE